MASARETPDKQGIIQPGTELQTRRSEPGYGHSFATANWTAAGVLVITTQGD